MEGRKGEGKERMKGENRREKIQRKGGYGGKVKKKGRKGEGKGREGERRERKGKRWRKREKEREKR